MIHETIPGVASLVRATLAANQIRVLMGTPNQTCANFSGGSVPAGFTALKYADFTGAGRGDVLLRNNATGEVRLLSLNATGLTLPPYVGDPQDKNASCTASNLALTTITRVLPVTPAAWKIFAIGDFNGDGITDIAWAQADGSVVVWLMQPSGSSPQVIFNAGGVPK